jgi:hypothetical protein
MPGLSVFQTYLHRHQGAASALGFIPLVRKGMKNLFKKTYDIRLFL